MVASTSVTSTTGADLSRRALELPGQLDELLLVDAEQADVVPLAREAPGDRAADARARSDDDDHGTAHGATLHRQPLVEEPPVPERIPEDRNPAGGRAVLGTAVER